ncbi:MAG TPA: hypothetical protein VIC85_10090 [Ktedonobacterales bacterium]|jgi:hypothetical protein
MAEMDQGIKRLLQAHPTDVLELAFPGPRYLGPLQTDVATEPQLVLDTLFRVRFQGEECAINVEAQATSDPNMPRRCFEYGARASTAHGLPVLSAVVWLRRPRPAPRTAYVMKVGTYRQAIWRVKNIEIYRMAADVVASGVLGLLPLVPFMRGADVPTIEAAGRAIHKREESADPGREGDLVSLLATFTALFHGEEAARALVRRILVNTDILDESPLIQSIRRDARAEGLREAVRLAIESRFGPLDEALMATLNAASEATLRDIIAHVATDTLEQLSARLAAPSS